MVKYAAVEVVVASCCCYITQIQVEYTHCYLYSKQDRQCTYNVTRRVRVTIIAVEKQKVLHILSV
jgi:hypothetical protein